MRLIDADELLLAICILGLAIVNIIHEMSIRNLEKRIRKLEGRQ